MEFSLLELYYLFIAWNSSHCKAHAGTQSARTAVAFSFKRLPADARVSSDPNLRSKVRRQLCTSRCFGVLVSGVVARSALVVAWRSCFAVIVALRASASRSIRGWAWWRDEAFVVCWRGEVFVARSGASGSSCSTFSDLAFALDGHLAGNSRGTRIPVLHSLVAADTSPVVHFGLCRSWSYTSREKRAASWSSLSEL